MAFEQLGERYDVMVGAVTIDTVDPVALGSWWAGLLGMEVRPLDDPPTYVVVPAQESGGIQLGFQKVPEPKHGKVRIHLDVITLDLDETQREIEERGGTFLAAHDFEGKWFWRVMADPEGHEFCIVLVEHREQ